MAYNTGNPVPSTDAKDFIDNCENLDKAVNSLDSTFKDRLGVTRNTWEGIAKGLSFFNVGTFAVGSTLTNSRQTLTYGGHEYGWSGVFPKVVTAGSTPTPLGSGGWIDRTDVVLRAEITPSVFEALRRSYAEAGLNLVDGSFEEGGTIVGSSDVLLYKATGEAYSGPAGTVAEGSTPSIAYTPRASEISDIPAMFGFVGDLTGSGDLSTKFIEMLSHAAAIGLRNIHFSKWTKFNINTRIENMGGIVLSGNAEILTTHADNRYIKCAKNETGVPDNLASLGDVSGLANSILDKKYKGESLKVVIIGDSIMMGGHNYRDYSWPARRVQDAIQAAIDVKCDFYNRAIAGSMIQEVLNVIPSYADPATAHAPGEAAWITDTGRTWLSYIDDIKPDMVVIGFGMNAMNADDLKYVIQVRAALKAISNPSIIWVTTPMRTVDPSKSLGTWPNNEYSNSAGIGYGKYADFVGDTVINVNAASNVVMNGIDVRSGAMNVEQASRYSATGSADVTVGTALSVVFGDGGRVSSQEYSRDCAIEFVVGSISNTLRVMLRQDPLTASSVYADITSSGITLYAPLTNSGEMGSVGTYSGATAGKRIRVQANGTIIFVAVDNIYSIEYETFGANFSNRAAVFTTTGTASISDLRFISATYKSNVKLLTTDEIFDPRFGLGGNYLNHPNPNGVEYLYAKPIEEFKTKLFRALLKNSAVLSESYPTLAAPLATYSSVISARREGNLINITGTKIQGDVAANTVVCTLDAKFWPAEEITIPLVLRSVTYKAVAVTISTSGQVKFVGAIVASDGQYGMCATYARVN